MSFRSKSLNSLADKLNKGLKPSPRPTPLFQDPVAVAALKNLKDKVQHEIKKYRRTPRAQEQRAPHTNDFARLARRLCGKSIGLVLGGGGARGLSHLVGRSYMNVIHTPTLHPMG